MRSSWRFRSKLSRRQTRAQEIMAVDGVDGCWIGPHDLSLSMGVDLSTPAGREAHGAAIVQIVEACRRTNTIPGISTGSVADAQRWIDEGCLFVTAGEDAGWMLEGAQETLRKLGRST